MDVDSQKESRRPMLSAIMFTDIKGFSGKMQKSESATMLLLEIHNRIVSESVERHAGTVVKTIGDAFLVKFDSVVSAVECAVEVQAALHEYNKDRADNDKILVRIGIHFGEIFVTESDVFGNGVNIASRIQSIADPGGLFISESAFDQVKSKTEIHAHNLGVVELKNIREKIRVYRIEIPSTSNNRSHFTILTERTRNALKRRKVQYLITVAASIILTVLVLRLWPTNATRIHTIAVLPIKNLADSTLEYVADGITEDLVNTLTTVRGIRVSTKEGSFYFKQSDLSLGGIASELGVQAILTGTMRNQDGGLSFDFELDDATADHSIWSGRYNGTLNDIVWLRREIVSQVAARLHFHEVERDTSLTSEVFSLYLRGLYEMRKRRREDNYIALSNLSLVVKKDSLFVSGIVALAGCQLAMVEHDWDRNRDWLVEASESCDKAIQLDSSISEPYALLGRIRSMQGNTEDAMGYFERALNLNPYDVTALTLLGEQYAFRLNDPVKAIQYFIRASQVNPMDHVLATNLAIGYGMLGNYPECINNFRHALRLHPTDDWVWQNLGVAYEKVTMIDSAMFAYTTAVKLNPANAEARQDLTSLYCFTGQFSKADSTLREGLRLDKSDYSLWYALGISESLLGQQRSAAESWKQGLSAVDHELRRTAKSGQATLYEGLFLARLRRTKEAEKIALDLARDTTDSDLVIGLSRLYAVLDKKELMLKWFARAKSMSSDFDEAYIRSTMDFQAFRNDSALMELGRK